ncbi:hypothetical protein ABW19_dt0200626 [Dactylella cylindrospora]|nr:hypothetical protein ABW19_dt0200626 [Dactylella cylindrospora]
MPVPQPPAPLGRHCTALVDNTLFAYTENGFYSLPLTSGGNWTEIEGTQVTTKGSLCIHTGQGTAEEALYVVGGDAAAGVETEKPEYNGLQKYVFSQKKWETRTLQDKTLFNLTHHGAAFLAETNQIFIYAGNWYSEDYTPSSMAFLVNVNDNMVSSLPTGLAPPLMFPIVQPLNAHTVIISAGDSANTHIYSYSTIEGWKDLPSTLAAPLPIGSSSGNVVQGDDGSKRLITFDFSKTPIDVEIIPLFNASSDSQTTAPAAKLKTRNLTSENWPKYNSTLAPKDTRTDFAITSNSQYIVISGGGPADDPLCIFDFTDGGWLNATAMFATQEPLDASSTASMRIQSEPTSSSKPSSTKPSTATITPESTNTSDSSSSTSSSAVAEPSGMSTSTQLLFIILGVVLLVGLILGSAYFILRHKRKKQKAARGDGEKPEGPQSRGMPRDSGMSFKDRGASFMKEAGGTKSTMFGKSRSLRRNNTKGGLDHPDIADLPRGAVLGPAAGTNLEMQPAHRGSGWSRYFSGNSTTNLVQNGAGLQRSTSDASRSSYSISEFPDDYDERRLSYPSVGYVRSSNASHSAVYSANLPTPTFGDVTDNSPPKNAGLLGFEPPRAPGLFDRAAGSQISVSSTGASSINFFGEALSHPDFAKKVAQAQTKHNLSANEDPSRAPSSVYLQDSDGDSMLQPPNAGFANKTDSFGFFGSDRDSNTAPRGDQGLGWFTRN